MGGLWLAENVVGLAFACKQEFAHTLSHPIDRLQMAEEFRNRGSTITIVRAERGGSDLQPRSNGAGLKFRQRFSQSGMLYRRGATFAAARLGLPINGGMGRHYII